MKAVARKRFVDKYTGETYEAGSLLDVAPERYAEIRETDPDLVIAVADEPGAAGQSAADDAETADDKTEPGAADQSAADDAKTEQEATDLSTADDAGTADGKKKAKKKPEKSAE